MLIICRDLVTLLWSKFSFGLMLLFPWLMFLLSWWTRLFLLLGRKLNSKPKSSSVWYGLCFYLNLFYSEHQPLNEPWTLWIGRSDGSGELLWMRESARSRRAFTFSKDNAFSCSFLHSATRKVRFPGCQLKTRPSSETLRGSSAEIYPDKMKTLLNICCPGCSLLLNCLKIFVLWVWRFLSQNSLEKHQVHRFLLNASSGACCVDQRHLHYFLSSPTFMILCFTTFCYSQTSHFINILSWATAER